MSRLFDISANPEQFLARYSSVLRNFIRDGDVAGDLAAATAFNIAQVLDLADEVKQSIGVHELVDRRRLYVVPIRLRESELRSDLNVFTYGSGAVYGDGHVFGAINTASVAFAVPQGIAAIGMLVDSFIAETQVLLPGSDFILRGQVLTLWRNPFDFLNPTAVYDAAGVVIDREIVLWGIDVAVWDRLAESMYGTIAGIADNGEAGYAAVVGALWDVLIGGASMSRVYAVLCAAAGVDLAAATEPVYAVTKTATATVVTTPTRVYRGHRDATAMVAAGGTLRAGEPVFDTVLIRDLARPDSDIAAIPALTFTALTPSGPVVVGFPNSTVRVWTGPQGLVFDIAGTADDVAAFWTEVRRREAAGSPTLGALLTAEFGTIPATLNPLRYLVAHMFLTNAVVVTIRPQHFLRDPALLAKASAVLVGLIPARTMLIQHSYLDDTRDSYVTANPFAGVDFFDGVDTTEHGRASGASQATELAYHDLQPMLAHYAR